MAAFKFIHYKDGDKTDREYLIFAYLNAINNPYIICFGVAALHYRGVLKDQYGRREYDIFGMSLLGKSLEDLLERERVFDSITILLILQKMIKVLKYIHGCNVIHNDIKPGNILTCATELVAIGSIVIAFCFYFNRNKKRNSLILINSYRL